jgi:hypothetical protein
MTEEITPLQGQVSAPVIVKIKMEVDFEEKQIGN